MRLKVFCLLMKQEVGKSRSVKIQPGILLKECFRAIESLKRFGRRIEDTIRGKERRGEERRGEERRGEKRRGEERREEKRSDVI